ATDPEGTNLQQIGNFVFDGAIAAGETITRTQLTTLPATLSGDRWIIVGTDAFNQIPEHAGENNNQNTAGFPTQITLQTFPNLVVTAVMPPATAFSGQQTEISWIVQNTGNGA